MLFDGWGSMLGMGIVLSSPNPYSLIVMTVNGTEYLISTSGVEALS
jgi:hypothetical protein